MKDIDFGDSNWFSVSYEQLIASFDVEVLLETWEGDYQGSTWAILRDGDGRYGWFTFGWGSCSGCDAAQACSSPHDAYELRDDLWKGIVWHDSAEALLAWVNSRDWALQWSWHASDFRDFLASAKALLMRQSPAAGGDHYEI